MQIETIRIWFFHGVKTLGSILLLWGTKKAMKIILSHKNKLFYIMYKLKILERLHILVDFNSIDLTPRMPL